MCLAIHGPTLNDKAGGSKMRLECMNLHGPNQRIQDETSLFAISLMKSLHLDYEADLVVIAFVMTLFLLNPR